MKFLDKYYNTVKQYYSLDEIQVGNNVLKREPLRMLLLIINEEEGVNPNVVREYFGINICRGGSYASLNTAKGYFDTDKHFKRRYEEILKLVKDGVH